MQCPLLAAQCRGIVSYHLTEASAALTCCRNLAWQILTIILKIDLRDRLKGNAARDSLKWVY